MQSKKLRLSPPSKDSKMSFDEWKKARRREQIRVSGANYRKRKREHEAQTIKVIAALKQEIKALETTVNDLRPKSSHFFQSIVDFYLALKSGDEKQQQRPDARKYEQTHGCTPALQFLAELMREEFDSVESLKLHWLWYRTQFRDFQFSIVSCERFNVENHVLIKVTGELRLGIVNREQSGYETVACPVLQQFEVEEGEQGEVRITSEVDLVRGIAAMKSGQSHPELVLTALQCLSENFCMWIRS
ncbi:hypothetical protein PHYBOEH_011340 [Phytophthora boehmeriae]|uniref:BZIP domain-containing protein n=1 Tax=Phytophthora boehmeriae TaxID=109152 RepID=A0A8T1VHJ6_9STRA|nr:hypothetical protein PHYBOEH_011340 [Phytophthora boehmeriae]